VGVQLGAGPHAAYGRAHAGGGRTLVKKKKKKKKKKQREKSSHLNSRLPQNSSTSPFVRASSLRN